MGDYTGKGVRGELYLRGSGLGGEGFTLAVPLERACEPHIPHRSPVGTEPSFRMKEFQGE